MQTEYLWKNLTVYIMYNAWHIIGRPFSLYMIESIGTNSHKVYLKKKMNDTACNNCKANPPMASPYIYKYMADGDKFW